MFDVGGHVQAQPFHGGTVHEETPMTRFEDKIGRTSLPRSRPWRGARPISRCLFAPYPAARKGRTGVTPRKPRKRGLSLKSTGKASSPQCNSVVTGRRTQVMHFGNGSMHEPGQPPRVDTARRVPRAAVDSDSSLTSCAFRQGAPRSWPFVLRRHQAPGQPPVSGWTGGLPVAARLAPSAFAGGPRWVAEGADGGGSQMAALERRLHRSRN